MTTRVSLAKELCSPTTSQGQPRRRLLPKKQLPRSLLELDLTARDAPARVARRLRRLAVHWRRARLGVVAAAEVVLVRVHHEAAADDRELPAQLDEAVHNLALRHTVRVRLDVPQVPDVALLVLRRPVGLPVRVVVRAGADAAVGEVRLLVDMEPVLPRRQAVDLVLDLALRFADLRQHDVAPAVRGALRRAAAGLAVRPDLTHCGNRHHASSSIATPLS